MVQKFGTNSGKLFKVFTRLKDSFSSDADDIALLYINKVKKGNVNQRLTLSNDLQLRKLLINILERGWTNDDEKQAINYLNSLG